MTTIAYQADIPEEGVTMRASVDTNWNVAGVFEKKLGQQLPFTLAISGLFNHVKVFFVTFLIFFELESTRRYVCILEPVLILILEFKGGNKVKLSHLEKLNLKIYMLGKYRKKLLINF